MSRTDPLQGVPGMLRDEPLARHSQFGVGGPAQWFARVRDRATLADVVRRARTAEISVTMLGAGSNALILDAGVPGLVVRYDDRHVEVVDDTMVALGGGCMMPRTALDCAARGLGGLEFGIGVPGTCGASVRGNAGAFGSEMANVIVDCTALTPDGEAVRFDRDACRFAYRRSAFAHELRDHIVVEARVRVTADDPALVRERTASVQSRRKASQPYGIRSLGSVFKNPAGETAGRLIESAGLKGRRSGGAEISSKHANFIVNVDHATAADVLSLVEVAHDEVVRRFGVDLEPEIVVLGGAARVTP